MKHPQGSPSYDGQGVQETQKRSRWDILSSIRFVLMGLINLIDPGRRDEHPASKTPPRLRLWHGIFWIVVAGLSMVWMVTWEVRWDRRAEAGRLIWNAAVVHAGPFAGIYHWDPHESQPNLIRRTRAMISDQKYRYHRSLIMVMFPIFFTLILPTVGMIARPVSKQCRLVIGAFFGLGTLVWYFSAMISIVMQP